MILADDLVDLIERSLREALKALPQEPASDSKRACLRSDLMRSIAGIEHRREELA